MPTPTPFGQRLRHWRLQRGLSQLALAAYADTTARHVSFLETGRSRPGRALVMRLAACLDLPLSETNALLQAAGLPHAFPAAGWNDDELRQYRHTLEAILKRHDPYPACVLNIFGEVLLCNRTSEALWPGLVGVPAEAMLDGWLAPGPGREGIDNFAEVAWAFTSRLQQDVLRTHDARLEALLRRALGHLRDVPFPTRSESGAAPVMPLRLRVGQDVIACFTTVLRFETARETTLSELRLEQIFPLDEAAERLFAGLAKGEPSTGHA